MPSVVTGGPQRRSQTSSEVSSRQCHDRASRVRCQGTSNTPLAPVLQGISTWYVSCSARHHEQSPVAKASDQPPTHPEPGRPDTLNDHADSSGAARNIRVRIALSAAARAIALDPAGITRSPLRTAIVRARAAVRHDRPHCEFSCTAMDSKRLLRFYKLAADYFDEHQDQLQAHICREACAVITRAHRRAGLRAGRAAR